MQRESSQTVKKASQNFVRMDETKSNSFFAPTSGSRKIQIGLQVWNLFAKDEQILRAADLLCPSRQRGPLWQNAPKEYFARLLTPSMQRESSIHYAAY